MEALPWPHGQRQAPLIFQPTAVARNSRLSTLTLPHFRKHHRHGPLAATNLFSTCDLNKPERFNKHKQQLQQKVSLRFANFHKSR
jgi:hypothetical protein